jgi:hypothetical protein
MEILINDVTSRVQATDSGRMLDPRVMAQIVQACVRAVKEDMEREKRFAKDRDISDSAVQERK